MSNSALRVLAASGPKDSPIYVEDVFSTDVYTGNNSSQNIVNGIDLSGEGGLVWQKGRSKSSGSWTLHHGLYDTERGTRKLLKSESTDGESSVIYGVSAFNSNGFSLNDSYIYSNSSIVDYVAWTFRKQPGFFDIQTYTGSGENGQTINHDLDAVPGMVIVKHTSSNGSKWYVYHRSLDSGKHLKLNSTNPESSDSNYEIGKTTCTSTQFSIDTGSEIDASGQTYIAYFFAHNDQRFGTDADEAIIKCDSYQGNGDIANQGEIDVNVGFEPQWLLIKRADGSNASWMIIDMMRRFAAHSSSSMYSLRPDLSDDELLGEGVEPTPTGFRITDDDGKIGANAKYVYVAIRRPQKPATEFAATELFNVVAGTAGNYNTPGFVTGFPVDMGIFRIVTSTTDFDIMSRITEARRLDFTNGTEANKGTMAHMDYMNGWSFNANTYTAWSWRRAPGYFDVLTYKGGQSAGSTVTHNLGVVPEMMWVKNRDNTGSWVVKHTGMTGGISGDYYMYLNSDSAEDDGGSTFRFNPSATQFTLSSTNSQINNSTTPANEYMAYLFATVNGISKVGSYSGTGSDLTIDCGFTNGARFVLVKSTTFGGDWLLWDSVRGITTNDDPYLALNSSNQQATFSTQDIEPHSSGFIVNGGSAHLNSSGQSYIFYAIA